MSISPADIAHILFVLALLLTFSHAFGYVFRRLNQPQVIGEIIGGMLLGPTFLGNYAPSFYQIIFVNNSVTSMLLGILYQLGLLLLMFCSGIELRALFIRSELKTTSTITVAGTLIPFLFGLAFFQVINQENYIGTAHNSTALLLVFSIAIAVTSIPVISRILYDLKLLDTDFSRIVLTAAVMEDVLLYIVLSIALSITGPNESHAFGLSRLLSGHLSQDAIIVYFCFITLFFFLFTIKVGPKLLLMIESNRYNLLQKSSPIAFQLTFLFLITGIALLLGVSPIFGAFAAGIVASHSTKNPGKSREEIKSFSFGFFIPIYFAIVGLKLDLLGSFDLNFFIIFLIIACTIKTASVFVGSLLCGEKRIGAWNIAIAMNARGGPGIVLASVSLDAGIINNNFYAVLVMLSIITSYIAGAWLRFVTKKGIALR